METQDEQVLDQEQATDSGPTQHQMRKGCKQRARATFKKHYALFVIICLLAVLLGTEFTFVKSQSENLYNAITGQEVGVEAKYVRLQDEKSQLESDFERLMDLVVARENALAQGDDPQAVELEEEADVQADGNPGDNAVTGATRGVLASLVNVFSSGKLIDIFYNSIASMFRSPKVGAIVFILLGLLLVLAVYTFIKNMIGAIVRRVFLESRLYKSVPISHMFQFRLFKKWKNASFVLLLRDIYTVLWTLTIVGGFIKYFSYYLVPYIVAENPSIKPREAINLSRRMMKGHKWECFKFELTFTGWHILGSFTFGLSQLLYSLPYRVAAFTEYYALLRDQAKRDGIEGAEKLNDDYLYEPVPEPVLSTMYADISAREAFIEEERIEIGGVRGFFAKTFCVWFGNVDQKKTYEDVKTHEAQIAEEKQALEGLVYPMRLHPMWDSETSKRDRSFNYLRSYTIWSLILIFFVFSVFGWCWEVSLHLITDGVFVNRGTMHGPWLPIYGGGVALILILLAHFRSRPLIEIGSIAVLCGFVEYFSSLIIELSTGLHYWDYTGYVLNLNGRICAEGLIVFALGGAAAVYLFGPLLDGLWSRAKKPAIVTICIVLIVFFLADVVYSHFVPNTGEGITDYQSVVIEQDDMWIQNQRLC